MTTTTVSPFVVSEATEVELSTSDGKKKFWRKEILPSGTRKYKNTTLDFSKINPACVKAFDDGAFDSVSFVLPLSDNRHPQPGQEVDNLEGNVHRLELADNGKLYGYFDFSTSPKVQGLIKKSGGKFGVSSRIEVNYHREDTDKDYEYALSHVCGTTRPHIKGMDPWESVELSEDEQNSETTDLSDEVIDFSNEGGELVTVQISPEELGDIRKFMKEAKDAEEYAKTLSEGGKPNGNEGKPPEGESVELTEARKQADMALRMARESRIELAQSRWQTKRLALANAGVPPVLLDLAEPALSLPTRSVIELTDNNGEKTTVDASEIIEKLLEEAKGTIKLGEEDGHGFGGDGSSKDDAEYKNFESSLLAGF